MSFTNNSNNNDDDRVKHSAPISIDPSYHSRRRSSTCSSTSSGSSNSPELATPISSFPSQKIAIPSPSSSPILSYFLAQSPTKTPAAIQSATFPFKRSFGAPPVFEDDEVPVASHTRRASASIPARFMQNPTLPEPQNERGTNLLRRLSLSTLTRPQVGKRSLTPPNFKSGASAPPGSAVSPTGQNFTGRKPGRSATISGAGERPRRAPSPMGERILKGHFDGFN